MKSYPSEVEYIHYTVSVLRAKTVTQCYFSLEGLYIACLVQPIGKNLRIRYIPFKAHSVNTRNPCNINEKTKPRATVSTCKLSKIFSSASRLAAAPMTLVSAWGIPL